MSEYKKEDLIQDLFFCKKDLLKSKKNKPTSIEEWQKKHKRK